MSTSGEADPEPPDSLTPSTTASGTTASGTTGRIPLVAFVLIEIVGVVFYVANGRKVWFFGVFGDEWDFLAGRRLTVHDLLVRHGDHLVALPALVFRLMYDVVGLRSYLPYQLLAIGLHLGTAALLRVVMRRAGVSPWIATAAATLFVFFGAGAQDILIAFQITFSGALLLGLTQLLLADHNGGFDRRDALALLAGLGALLCSDVAIVMIATVGVAALLQRRWRSAALQTIPLGAVYLVWSETYGRSAQLTFHLGPFVRSIRVSISSSFNALGQVPLVGWLLAVMLVVGLVLAVSNGRNAQRRLSAPVAMLMGAFLFSAFIALSRFGLGLPFAASGRYLHIVAAMLLPAIAVAGDAIARRKQALIVAVVGVLLVGIPGNVTKVGRSVLSASFYVGQHREVASLPRLPLAREVPRSLHPFPGFAAEVTVGWLLDGVASGRIPATSPSTPLETGDNTLRLSLEQLDTAVQLPCPRLPGAVNRRIAKGATLGVRGTVAMQLLGKTGRPESNPVAFGGSLLSTNPTHTLRADAGPLFVRIVPRSPTAGLC